MSETPAPKVVAKTKADAEKFAATLTMPGDADLFLDLFEKGQEDTIRGHFPDFYKKGGN